MGVESVTLAEARRTADYQTTVFDCISKLLERCVENRDEDEISAEDKQKKVRIIFYTLRHLISINLNIIVEVA